MQMGGSADVSALAMQISAITMRGLARRSSNVSAELVARELSDRYQDDLPDFTGRGVQFEVIDGLVFNSVLQRNTEKQLRLFLASSLLIALVAAANVSLFLLARAPGRRRELGIRMAVGAPLKRLGRQLASEAALLVVLAAMLGVALSIWFAQFLRGLSFLREAQWRDVTLLDWRVLGLIGALLLLLTGLVSLAPILGLKKLGIAGSSRRIPARATAAQRMAGTAQIGVAITLAGAAVAFSWHLGSLMLAYPGYETRNLHAATLVFTLRPDEASQSAESRSIENTRRREAILSLPSVTRASLAGAVPGLMVFGGGLGVPDLNDPTETIQLRGTIVDAHYVDLLGLRLLHGRSPTEADVGVIVVNQALARRVFGRENVVGESLPISVAGGQRVDIVGVVEDVPFEHPADDVEPMLFATAINIWSPRTLALIESRLPSAELQRELQGLSESGAIELTINEVQPLKSVRRDRLAADSARGYLTIGGALLVVLLAVVGFYGTQRYLVRAGRREYAIRASLGAGPRRLGRLVLQRGLLLALPGLALGLLPAFLLVAWLRDNYVSRDVSPLAVTVSVAIGFAFLLTAASFGPARQARQTQPAPLLRED
jgi:ABC-type antimicrobial peptide transport system permease subunit